MTKEKISFQTFGRKMARILAIYTKFDISQYIILICLVEFVSFFHKRIRNYYEQKKKMKNRKYEFCKKLMYITLGWLKENSRHILLEKSIENACKEKTDLLHIIFVPFSAAHMAHF